MRIELPGHVVAVLVGTCLVGCTDPSFNFEVHAGLTTRHVEMRARVERQCGQPDCRDGSGFNLQARTPQGTVVDLSEIENTVGGTYGVDTEGIASSYAFLVDGEEFRFESPARFTAKIVITDSLPRLVWNPALASDEELRVNIERGTDASWEQIFSPTTSLDLEASTPGRYEIAVRRLRFASFTGDVAGYVSFERFFVIDID